MKFKDKMENLMDQNMERLQNYLESIILHILDERFPKSDIVTQGNNENKEIKIFEPHLHMGNILTHMDETNIE
jgi:hypothetical protein